MGRTNIYRTEAIEIKVNASTAYGATLVDVVETGNPTYDIPIHALPAGAYRLALYVDSTIGVADCQLALVPYADEAQSQLSAAPLNLQELGDTASATSITLAATAKGTIATALDNIQTATTPQADRVIVLPYGLQVQVTTGTAGNVGDALEIRLIAVRVT